MADLHDRNRRSGVFDQVQYPIVALADALLSSPESSSEPGGRGVVIGMPRVRKY